MFAFLAKRKYKNQKEIAAAYGVSEAAVSQRLGNYREGKIDYRLLMPWETLSKHRTGRPARSLRLHLRARLRPHTLTAEEAREHEQWLTDLETKVVDYTIESGWRYIDRQPAHEDLVAVLPDDVELPTVTDLAVVLPDDVELPTETVDLYRRRSVS
ncbi:hypothetical protein ACFU7T_11925 [Streptomyces sp. NPDC057555]|uniref:hypothetical protein n=1 Tax=Streptomyces sp. NPDC057555 TaxID=3346166 RepID=UPI0036BA7F12